MTSYSTTTCQTDQLTILHSIDLSSLSSPFQFRNTCINKIWRKWVKWTFHSSQDFIKMFFFAHAYHDIRHWFLKSSPSERSRYRQMKITSSRTWVWTQNPWPGKSVTASLGHILKTNKNILTKQSEAHIFLTKTVNYFRSLTEEMLFFWTNFFKLSNTLTVKPWLNATICPTKYS